MTARVTQALFVYLRQRWAVPALAVLSLIAAGLLLAGWAGARSGGVDAARMMLTNVIALPAMGVSFWVTSVVKWQFANPRARLLPGYQRPHLAVAAGWLFAALIVYPIFAGVVAVGADPLAICGYAMLAGGLFLWAMHTNSQVYSLGGVVVMLAPMAPAVTPLFFGNDPGVLALRLGVAAAGITLVATWMKDIGQLTEESPNYQIPVFAQSGKASRMEKSEMRRLMAKQVSGMWLVGWIVDRWHDPLANAQAPTPGEKRSLLRYGFSGAPAWSRCLGLVGMMIMIVMVNTFMMRSLGNEVTIYPFIGMMMFMAPFISLQLVAMRKPRMQTELFLPMTRGDLVDGVFRAVAREAAMSWVVSVLLVAAAIAWSTPEWFTADRALAAMFASAAGLAMLHALGMMLALVNTGIVRMLLMVFTAYAIVGVLVGAGHFYLHDGQVIGLSIAAAVLIIGVLLTRVARGRWMRTELG